MRIHKEGRKTLTYTLLIGFVINFTMFYFLSKNVFTYLIFISTVVVFLFLVNFFRSPNRVYSGELLGRVNAPTDGKVVALERVFEKEYLNEECIKISIFMTIFNAHSNWIPVTGKIIHVSHQKGRFLGAYLPKSSTENERSTIVIETPDGHKILSRQIAGALARRIVTYVKESQICYIGDPLGFIKFGSRMDIFLPLDSDILVKIGDEVRANNTFIANLATKH
ncbi:MAG: phosphatidylserine decarboxylase family protein [Dysgonamonadaceae bacterium]|nr:phosphatidylserine decarboxylase family protein [Dysgonamonadaceae bacterium]MDD4727592.1 phosphatidylserine decarboxylase family protein [Dysgonamonadaceae bacterium]